MGLVVSLVMIAFALPFLAIGIGGFLFAGSAFLSAGRQITGAVHSSVTDPVDPGELPESGHAVVHGRITAGPNGLATGPFSGRDCVAYRYGIEQQSDDVGWWEVVDSEHTRPFVLEGDLGRVLVDPGDESLGIEVDGTDEIAATEQLPETTRARLQSDRPFADDVADLALAGAVDEPRRYAEGILETGQTAYVYGAVTDDPTHGTKIDADASRLFNIRSESPEGLTEQEGDDVQSIAKHVLVGLFALVFGIMFGAGGVMVASMGLQGVL